MKLKKYKTRVSENVISKEYRAWKGMKARCYAPCNKHEGNYQKLKIIVCERWLNSFDNFMDDIGYAPSLNHTLDRIDNLGNYSPSNCRWVLQEIQTKNRGNNKVFTYNGETKVLSDWARDLGINYSKLHKRLYKMSFEEAVNFKI